MPTLPPTPWSFPDPTDAPEDLVAVGGDLDPATILAGYAQGLFPMHADERRRHLGWWSPNPRGILPLDALVIHRSLRAACRRYRVTFDADFEAVIGACRTVKRPAGWITPGIESAYVQLHRLGWTHSVEVWDDDELVGGLYGVAIGGLFAGESMFHYRRDASKVALVALVEQLRAGGATLLDVQWVTPHLARLGAIPVPRAEYLQRVRAAIDHDPLPWPRGTDFVPNTSTGAGPADG